MSKRQFLIILGVWVMIVLYLGFPTNFHRPILLVTGLLIIVMSYRLKPETKSGPAKLEEKTFTDSISQSSTYSSTGTTDKIS